MNAEDARKHKLGVLQDHRWMNKAKHAKREKMLSDEKYTSQKVKAE